MKISALLLSILFTTTAVDAGYLPANLVEIVSDNIRDARGEHHEPFRPIQMLCLNALDEGIGVNDLAVLTDFAGGTKTIAQSTAESFWRKAANYAVFNIDGDVDRLVSLASGDHQDAAIAALNVLSQLDADAEIGDYFIQLFVKDWELGVKNIQRNARRGEWCTAIAGGLSRHAGPKLSSEVAPFIKKRIIDTSMMVSLFFAMVEQSDLNEGADIIVAEVFMRTMDPFYLSEMASALKSINKLNLIAQKAGELSEAAAVLLPTTEPMDRTQKE